jgi:hypothetical protein
VTAAGEPETGAQPPPAIAGVAEAALETPSLGPPVALVLEPAQELAEPTLAPAVLRLERIESPVAPPVERPPPQPAPITVAPRRGPPAAPAPAPGPREYRRPDPAPAPYAYPRQAPAAPYVYPRAAPTSPYAYPAPAPTPGLREGGGAPRTIDEPAAAGFPTREEADYESSVRTRALIEQSQRGALDGGWLVSGTDGAALFALQLVDEGYGTLDGAWRDASATPASRSGFFAFASRYGGPLVLRFMERPGQPLTSLTLTPAPGGRGWTGELERGGTRRPVVMRPL